MHIYLQDIFVQMQAQLDHQAAPDASILIDLVQRIRPKDTQNTSEINETFQDFIQSLISTPNAIYTLQHYILRLLNSYKQSGLYADSGILSLDGFWNQLSQRIGAHFLPPLRNNTELSDLISQVFHLRSDRYWLENIQDQNWIQLFQLFGHLPHNLADIERIEAEMIKAITVLSYRISGIGLYPEFINAQPELSEYESPFLVQNREIVEFIEQYKQQHSIADQDTVVPIPDASQALVMIEQCRDVLLKIRRATKRIGVSISLTYLLSVLEQCLDRIELLLNILVATDELRYTSMGELLTDLVAAHQSENSVRSLLVTNSELIALQVTENASKTGEHYVSSDKKGFLGMYKAAAGAGGIIATMATLKILAARLTLAPLMQAFIFSMNYSFGFMLIHVLHFTVATKQPAMTAAALAATVQQRKGSKTAQIAELASLIINIIRTQFVAILGNISIAIPTAALITWLWQYAMGEALLNHHKADSLLDSLNPFTSLAVPHAAIAGVCLFLSGLIAGYFDNLAIYRKIGPRLRAHPKLQGIMKTERLEKFSHYIERNLGALAGNFLFGIMLGSMGTIGFIFGLPLDIRHIAFASANLIQGLLCTSSADIGLIFVSILGVILIGITNLFVSFSLTIVVALRARRVRFEQWKPLAKLVMTHFFTRPLDFFWPPKAPIDLQEVEQNHSKTHQ
ncbi:site-specific recombinase [Acinetobacter larvae]|uniref:Recombinase n=1 Tax=Acinetobacter larvae TaxID=1789224 RepID=A0A1B2LXE9_9GAMM|nr:site-specific recombinase [Acinetobacter larvae]AOA57624.1 recombinase [Acinetobacter larvae]